MSTRVKDIPQLDRVAAPARLPEQAHIGAVHVQISDLERSVEYYQGVLGLDVLERGSGLASLGVRGAAPLAYLIEKAGAQPVPRRGRFGLYHFAILLPDRIALGRFAAHLLRRGLRPGMADHGVSEALYLNDPDGLGIEVYADRPPASWTYRGEELPRAFLAQRYGQRPERLLAPVEAAGRQAGLALDFSKVRRVCSTVDAHTLARHAQPKGTTTTFVDAVFNAYFLEGRNIASRDVLSGIAVRHGFTRAEAPALLEDVGERRLTLDAAGQAMKSGVKGVPLYVMNGRETVSGAHAPLVFTAAIERALASVA